MLKELILWHPSSQSNKIHLKSFKSSLSWRINIHDNMNCVNRLFCQWKEKIKWSSPKLKRYSINHCHHRIDICQYATSKIVSIQFQFVIRYGQVFLSKFEKSPRCILISKQLLPCFKGNMLSVFRYPPRLTWCIALSFYHRFREFHRSFTVKRSRAEVRRTWGEASEELEHPVSKRRSAARVPAKWINYVDDLLSKLV